MGTTLRLHMTHCWLHAVIASQTLLNLQVLVNYIGTYFANGVCQALFEHYGKVCLP